MPILVMNMGYKFHHTSVNFSKLGQFALSAVTMSIYMYIAINWLGVKSWHFLLKPTDAVRTCTIPGMWHSIMAARLILTPLQRK